MAQILLADDDNLARYTIRHMLIAEGHQVIEAEHGEQALEVLSRITCDLAIVDILMPDKDGLEVIMELKRRQCSIPVLAISGGGRSGFNDFARMSMLLGAKDFLAKPFDLQAIKQKLASLLPASREDMH